MSKVTVGEKSSEKVVYFAKVTHYDLRNLEGKILTIVDACIAEPQQKKAMKDIIRRTFWFDWVEHLDREDKDLPVGIPFTDEQ